MTIKKLYKIIIVLLFFSFGIYHYFFYVDFKNDCYIKIKLSWLEFSNLSIKQALKTLKYASPEDYQKVCAHVDIINPNYACGGFQGGCFYSGSSPKEIHVSTSQRSLSWAIGIIMHETCHAIQFQEGRSLNEQECYAEDDRILKKIVQF